MIKLLEWTFPQRKITEHRKILSQAGDALDRLEAALDGETGWLDCGCVEKTVPEPMEGFLNDPFFHPKQRKCAG